MYRIRVFIGFLLLFLAFIAIQTKPVFAATPLVASNSAPTSTNAAVLPASITELLNPNDASIAADVVQKIQEKKDQDITETKSKQQDKLVAYLDEHPIGNLSWNNFLQIGIRNAINKGLPANLVVLLILFPLITSIIAASRHVIGLRGFGVYIPAVLAVAFVSTGVSTGILTFSAILFAAIGTHRLLKKIRMPYLPRTAMLLWGVSILVLVLLIVAANFQMSSLFAQNIFPLLIIMLLSENFMESQVFTSQKEAIRLTLETLLIATICSLIIGSQNVQQAVILNPELTLLAIAITNIALGRYTGLRLLEYIRFQNILEKKS